MEQEVTKLYMDEVSQHQLYKIFGLRKVLYLQELEDWLTDLPSLNNTETIIAKHYQRELIENIDVWNEQELSLNFIGPIFSSIHFTVLYQLKWFAQRSITKIIDGYELIGKPDGIIASGYSEPEIPYFSFQEFKKDVNSSGDPIGQNLAAMLVGQAMNEAENTPIYGCYVVGRNWYFMILKGKEFTISKAFTADDEDILKIIQILKALRALLFDRLGIKKKMES